MIVLKAICISVTEIANKFDVSAIIAFTESGFTARKCQDIDQNVQLLQLHLLKKL